MENRAVIVNMGDLVTNMKTLNVSGCDCHKDTTKRKEVYANLNYYQKRIYDHISFLLKIDKSKVILMDAPSGTGKTFLLSILAAANKQNTKFITFRKDQASDLLSKDVDSYTYISFSMRYFKFSYFQAIHMYDSCGEDAIDILYKLIVYSQTFKNSQGIETIILDMYTIPPPTMLLLLYILSVKNRIHLIFVGDNLQLDAINKSEGHKGSNYSLIQILKDTTAENGTENARICDRILKTSLSSFRNIILQSQSNGRLQFRFDLQYSLYKLFRSKYFTEERFDTVYIAQYHKHIKARMSRFEKYLDSIAKLYVKAPFYYGTNNFWEPVPPKRGKFSYYIILAEGYKYIHITSSGVHSIVYLDKIFLVDGEAETLRLRFVNNNEVIEVARTKLSYAQVLPAHRRWLLRNHASSELYQFPLRQYAFTYHAALGRTIEKDQVELNIDCVKVNHAYIGLNCVRHNFDIHRIHNDRSLLSYVVTEYMETERQNSEYYYRCPAVPLTDIDSTKILEYVSKQGVNKFIENISWIDVDIDTFEKKSVNCYVRTRRSYYQESKEEVATTSLMQGLAKFVKENPTVIRDAIGMATAEDLNFFTGNGDQKKKNKGKKKKESDKERPVIAYLKEEYDRWIDAEEKKIKA